MGLQLLGSIELPDHTTPGGFDHTAYHPNNGRIYVAHTINNALDVIDCGADQYLRPIAPWFFKIPKHSHA